MEIAVNIDGKRYRYWTQASVTRSLDAPDTVSFSSPFEPDRAELREAFKPFSFKDLDVDVDGARIFSGTLVTAEPDLSENSTIVDCSGYARAGVLQDCTAPPSLWPVEYDGLTLPQIADALCDPFGLSPVFEAPAGSSFERVSIGAGESVWRFLSSLAHDRGLVIGTNADGDPVFRQSVQAGQPVARLKQGDSPLQSVRVAFSPQEYYTHITAHEPARAGTDGSQYTAANPFSVDGLRPHVFEPRDAETAGVQAAAEAKLGRMFANVVEYDVEVAGWEDASGNLWEPNTIVTLDAPGAMIYRETAMLIRSVTLDTDERSKTATLRLVLPGAFAGEAPEALPWD
jgi:prophage tail gpP-like protein